MTVVDVTVERVLPLVRIIVDVRVDKESLPRQTYAGYSLAEAKQKALAARAGMWKLLGDDFIPAWEAQVIRGIEQINDHAEED